MAKTIWHGWQKEVPKNLTEGGIIFGANLRKQSADSSTKQSDEAMTPRAKRYRLAAEQGDAIAQSYLGAMYYLGEEVPQDDVEGAKWCGLAAEQGERNAQYLLGVMHYHGKGVPRDFVQAHLMLNLAASQCHEHSIAARDTIVGEMTPAQIEEAERMAQEWLATHP